MAVKISSVNLNSINFSERLSHLGNNNFTKKLRFITTIQTDFLLVQDLRLVGPAHLTMKNLLAHSPNGSFEFISNSTLNHRGVGIIYKKDKDVEILDVYRDDECNLLGVNLLFNGKKMLLISAYAPNQECQTFLNNIMDCVERVDHSTIVIGGDMNTILDRNTDIINSIRRPNAHPQPIRAEFINNLIRNDFFSDTFRFKHKHLKQFTFHRYENGRLAYASRLDYLLVHKSLEPNIKYANIEPKQLHCLDHNPINCTLSIDEPHEHNLEPKIKPNRLDIEYIYFFGRISVMNSFATNGNAQHPYRTNPNLINRINIVASNIKKNLLTFWTMDKKDLLYKQIIMTQIFETEQLLDEYEYQLISDPTYFDEDITHVLTVTMSNLKSDISRYQRHFIKAKTIKTDQINKEYRTACRTRDYNTMQELELKLNRISEEKNRAFLKKSRFFSIIENERPTKSLCALAKAAKKQEPLTQVCNQDGNPFDNNENRNNYISAFYGALYEKKETEGSIEDFLGDLNGNEKIEAKKLTEQEKAILDRPFTIPELDSALKNVKKINGAPGLDGFNYEMLKIF